MTAARGLSARRRSYLRGSPPALGRNREQGLGCAPKLSFARPGVALALAALSAGAAARWIRSASARATPGPTTGVAARANAVADKPSDKITVTDQRRGSRLPARSTSPTAARRSASAGRTTRRCATSSTSPTSRAQLRAAGRAVRAQDRRLRACCWSARPARPAPIPPTSRCSSANAGDQKTVYQKTYKVEVDTKGASQGPFQLVPDPIMLPLTRTDLDELYTVTIGLGDRSRRRAGRQGGATKRRPHAPKTPTASRTLADASALTNRARFRLLGRRQFKTPSGRVRAAHAPARRRRRNRPGNAQAEGPLGDDALESGFRRFMRRAPTDGGNRVSTSAGNLSGQRTEGATLRVWPARRRQTRSVL